MGDCGIEKFMVEHPGRFRRRVRRGIPPQYRWQVWKAALRLQDSEAHRRASALPYQTLCSRQNSWTAAIEIDIGRTFPELPTFDEAQQKRLLRILNAYASYNPDVGY